ncbi:DUF3261 domain-containing protein [Pectobacterium parmentieri]|uniref:DUF3261 domain-containing protein n=1 Tax=Pectobacterium parmentieri TaxID=1905730 RepID=A0A0H3ICH8_PECPM|nr:DUF3261 domain-containing protein [Pectobacterium parmentieri]AFI92804.1 Hypothetical protein W5S_4764 [Pectobacterium parmentieri]MBI0469559.1 DUF3261 domain-containing protein [Pectobacterium parmentieri]MBI0493440.1 DUF3261 domain-containing protein [Pectobacterium parmentieri]MBI0553297.1 DUF3261 domain-containing protein [Pectobacterium parmentieri]MBI0567720.1 DUF3261 domain-containing protein [Pectobacterium parmentieri]
MTLLRRGLLLIGVLVLVGCASKQHDDGRPQAWLKPGVKVTLPVPAITPSVNEQQLLTGTFDGKQQSLLVMLSADDKQLSLVGLSSIGIRLFNVTYDAQGVHTEQSIVLPQLPPASQVLADIMLSHWPIAVWQTQLPAGWTLKDSDDKRQLRDNRGTLITEIRYMTRNNQRVPMSVQQFVFGYHIVIQHLDS